MCLVFVREETFAMNKIILRVFSFLAKSHATFSNFINVHFYT